MPSPHYPVLEVVEQLKTALAANNTAILQAPPGAGKSTVLPLRLYDEPWLAGRKLIMLEPRRLAARAIAHRLAQQLDEQPGNTVGYRIRFDTCVSTQTRIEVVTEGILTRMLQSDNSLEEYGLVIFDEFHERSLNTDLALVLCRQAQHILRADLRILIMSATLDASQLTGVLGKVPVITSTGRQHPVTLKYLSPQRNETIAQQVVRAVKKCASEERGDILAFLPGAAEIAQAAAMLEPSGLVVCPLYGDLTIRQQQQAIIPDTTGRRKVVLATSIAETSLTIEGIGVVVDSGYSRVPRFDPRSGLTRLETIKVTADAADQRAGRSGRLGPGVCYRLWPETSQHLLQKQRTPEILEADLAPALLELYQWGIGDPYSLEWITPPPLKAVSQAREVLEGLDAVSDNKITGRGRRMLNLPTHPRLAHMILEAQQNTRSAMLLPLATELLAVLEEKDPLGKSAGADASLRIEALRRWRKDKKTLADRSAMERLQRSSLAWQHILKTSASDSTVTPDDIGLLIMAAYPERVARQESRHSSRYKLKGGTWARLAEKDDLIREEWLAVAHLGDGLKEGRIFLAAPLDKSALMEHAVDMAVVEWDEEHEMLSARKERRVGSLTLESKPMRVLDVPQVQREDILLDRVRDKGLTALAWGEEQEDWQARVMSLRAWRPEEGWPDVMEETLLKAAGEWLRPFLSTVTKKAELQGLDLHGILNSILPWEKSRRLNTLAPARMEVPSGSSVALRYFTDGRSPELSVRLQEVFGMPETPAVNEGRTRVVMRLLSPGYKPVQVTQDMKSFWSNTYPEVRKELRMRYPRHSWPEDPWTARAVKGVRKKS